MSTNSKSKYSNEIVNRTTRAIPNGDGTVVCENCGCILHTVAGKRFPMRRPHYHGPLGLYVLTESKNGRLIAAKIIFVGMENGTDFVVKSIVIKDTFGYDHTKAWKTPPGMPLNQVEKVVSAVEKTVEIVGGVSADVFPASREGAVVWVTRSQLKGDKFYRAIKAVAGRDVFDPGDYEENAR